MSNMSSDRPTPDPVPESGASEIAEDEVPSDARQERRRIVRGAAWRLPVILAAAYRAENPDSDPV
ncbi:hypothetical protein [Microbacterium sp. NPDC056052]|uniref:hypothetical protein n=1 Tax=Microbacterium sp. NPDC056052 TaxID=3345695 RepID=UPI0035DA2C52